MQFLFNLIESIQYKYVIKFYALPNLLYAYITAEDTGTLMVYTKKTVSVLWTQSMETACTGEGAHCVLSHIALWLALWWSRKAVRTKRAQALTDLQFAAVIVFLCLSAVTSAGQTLQAAIELAVCCLGPPLTPVPFECIRCHCHARFACQLAVRWWQRYTLIDLWSPYIIGQTKYIFIL